MSKIYAQNFPVVWSQSGSFVASGSNSACAVCNGYAQIVGIFRSDVVSETGSGFRIQQSADWGANWDIISTSCLASACAASSFAVDIVGNGVRVFFRNGAGAASAMRTFWQLKPI